MTQSVAKVILTIVLFCFIRKNSSKDADTDHGDCMSSMVIESEGTALTWDGTGTRRIKLTVNLEHYGSPDEEIIFKLRNTRAKNNFLKIFFKSGNAQMHAHKQNRWIGTPASFKTGGKIKQLTIEAISISKYHIFFNGQYEYGAYINDEEAYDTFLIEKGGNVIHITEACGIVNPCKPFKKWEAGKNHDTAVTLKLDYGKENFEPFDPFLEKSNKEIYDPQSIKFIISHSRIRAVIEKGFAKSRMNAFPHKGDPRTLSIFPSRYNEHWSYRIFTNNDTTSGSNVISDQIFDVLRWDLGRRNSYLHIGHICVWS